MFHKRTLTVPAALLAVSLAAGAAYAQQSQTTPPKPAPQQSPGAGMMGNGQMMGEGGGMQGMMGMMNMMAQASQMMGTCNNMMKSAMQTPNGQWQKPNQTPGNKG